MPECDHTLLLQVAGDKGVALYDFGRFEQVTRKLPNPDAQFPRLVHFVGRQHKDSALKQFFPYNNFGRSRQQGIAKLRLSRIEADTDSPLLFLDSDPFVGITSVPQPAKCHPSTQHPLTWYPHLDSTVNDVLHARLLFLFSDVVCVFVDDFPSLEDSALQLIRWARISSASKVPCHVRPRVIVIISDTCVPRETADTRLEAFYHSLYEGCRERLNETFAAIQIFRLDDQLSPLSRHRRLKEIISNHTLEVSNIRQHYCVRFSATHLQIFFTQAAAHVSRSVETPFNFLSTARIGNHVDDDLVYHLTTFLHLARKSKMTAPNLTSYISSALFMDAYPPRMHAFDALDVFREHYQVSCLEALRQCCDSTELAHSYCSNIEYQMYELARTLQREDTTSSHLRAESLKVNSFQWSILRTNQTCLYCLRRRPEHVLPCAHSVCDACVMMLGTDGPGVEHCFNITACFLCRSEIRFSAKIKPPTAGVRILSLDGGGTRGVITLESMCLLQSIIPQLPLRELFDLKVGTSSGGVIALGLDALRWEPVRCSEVFDNLARRLFGHKQTTTSSLLARLKKYLHCWISDGVYDPVIFESALKETFGPERRLFGTPQEQISGSKVAVVTATISDATPFVVSNYNGLLSQDQSRAYELLRPENVDDEPYVWEAAAATSAAPILYRTVRIGDLGDFQDGGVNYNNPSRLALSESRRIWPGVEGPDVFLSLGTGTDRDVKPPKPSHFRHIINDGFVSRLYRLSKRIFDGEWVWEELINSLDEHSRPDYFRLNVSLPKSAVIDDTAGMEQLRTIVRAHPTASAMILEIARFLLASCFYFELDSAPVYDTGRYLVRGSIKCRLNPHDVFDALENVDILWMEYALDVELLSKPGLARDDICPTCHRYRHDVQFYIRHPTDTICIYMKGSNNFRRKLSGFPRTLEWFVEQQGLRHAFGTSSHGSPGRLRCGTCRSRAGQKPAGKRSLESIKSQAQTRKRLRV